MDEFEYEGHEGHDTRIEGKFFGFIRKRGIWRGGAESGSPLLCWAVHDIIEMLSPEEVYDDLAYTRIRLGGDGGNGGIGPCG
jgi:hypothetical protein